MYGYSWVGESFKGCPPYNRLLESVKDQEAHFIWSSDVYTPLLQVGVIFLIVPRDLVYCMVVSHATQDWFNKQGFLGTVFVEAPAEVNTVFMIIQTLKLFSNPISCEGHAFVYKHGNVSVVGVTTIEYEWHEVNNIIAFG